uniref:Uncharacterized protein n=1 Tax=Vibrio sp. 23023 TaxID=452803 RepID=A9M4R1_9VIBR|nr:Hypothetical protein BMSA_0043 [Vibrio sp. 23023]
MSQHTFQSHHYSVLCGWDAPLQGFFLVIEDSITGTLIYSNLNTTPSHPKSFDPFLTILNQYQITVHEQLLKALHEDQSNNIGNHVVDWGTFDHLNPKPTPSNNHLKRESNGNHS